MQINADFSQRTVMRFADTPWVASPAAGVERKMLDRIGGEVARATTIVRFAPGSAFDAHTHDGGEEYLVLDGTFEDETGDFGTGSYVRNPPTSRHTPAASNGTTIFVKLHQFDPDDRAEIHARTDHETVLFENREERVEIAELAPGATLTPDASGGLELLVLNGAATEAADTLIEWNWLRLPAGSTTTVTASPSGAKLWLKSGHFAARPPAAPGA